MNKLSPLVKNNVTVGGNLNAGRSIVFVHGFGTDQTVWKDVASTFATDYRLIFLDNFGTEGAAPGAFQQHNYLNLEGYVKDLLDVAAELRLSDAILVGHSVGGMISVLAAIHEPKHFSRLILVCSSPRYLNDEGYRGGFAKSDIDGLYSAVVSSYATWANGFAHLAMGNEERPHLALNFAETLKRIPSEIALTVLCAIFQSDHRADLAKLDKPTLIVQSTNDIAVPMEVAEYLHKNIPGSRLRAITASGHLPHVSAPDQIIKAMQDFFDCF